MKSGQRVLVTGATGLVGSWLVKQLIQDRAHPVCLIRDSDPQSELMRSGLIGHTTVVNGCLEDYSAIERAISEHDVDTVFHLGAQPIVATAFRSPLATFEANIRGTYNLLEACRVHSQLVKRVVVASSDKAYGSSKVLPYTEDMPVQGRHPYDVSKSCTDLLAQCYFKTYDLPVAVARCGNIYGGGDLNWSRIVPGTIRSFLRDERPVLRSNGGALRDYVYVEDAVHAYIRIADMLDDSAVRGEAFNFGPSKPLTVLEMVKQIGAVMGKQELVPIVLDEAKGEIEQQYLDSAKAKRLLNLSPVKTLEAGLCETAGWYAKYLGSMD